VEAFGSNVKVGLAGPAQCIGQLSGVGGTLELRHASGNTSAYYGALEISPCGDEVFSGREGSGAPVFTEAGLLLGFVVTVSGGIAFAAPAHALFDELSLEPARREALATHNRRAELILASRSLRPGGHARQFVEVTTFSENIPTWFYRRAARA
jgi:hypothetical protein